MLVNLGRTLHSLELDLRGEELPEAPFERFHSLKSLFCPEPGGEWYTLIQANQTPVHTAEKFLTNVFAELCENYVDPNSEGLWMGYAQRQIAAGTKADQKVNYQLTSEHLKHILISAYIEKESVLESFAELKITRKHKPEGYWLTHEVNGLPAECDVQLLGAAIECMLGTGKGPAFYASVKAFSYDEDSGFWGEPFEKDVFKAKDQLMGIYAELQFDPKAAFRNYEALKKSVFYDEDLGQWNYECGDGRVVCDIRDINDQFLELLIEFELAKKLHIHPALKEPTLPVGRGF